MQWCCPSLATGPAAIFRALMDLAPVGSADTWRCLLAALGAMRLAWSEPDQIQAHRRQADIDDFVNSVCMYATVALQLGLAGGDL